jgi:WD40 repeat protein
VRTLDGHTRYVNGVAVTSDGRFAVSASHDTTLKVWDLGTGQVLRTLEGHTRPVDGVAVTSDGRFAVSASYDKTLKVWDLIETAQPITSLETHTLLSCCATTTDAKTILAGDPGGALHVLDWLHPQRP